LTGTDQFLIASGGDDNAIRLSQVTITTGPTGVQITEDMTGHEPSAHAAQIIGTKSVHIIM